MTVYKVFLVEDEIVAREGIRDNVDWQSLGFTFCGEAPDGEMALPLIQESRPDVLITDIKMPFMNGLQLCRIVREQFPAIKIIILSGYDDFKYAQEAITLGVTEYLLKPVGVQDLRTVLRRIAAQLDDAQQSQTRVSELVTQLEDIRALRQNEFLLDVLLGRLSTSEALMQSKELGIDLMAQFYLVLLITIRLDCDGQSLNYRAFQQAEQTIKEVTDDHPDILSVRKDLEEIVLLLKGKTETYLMQEARTLSGTLREAITSRTPCTPIIGRGNPKERLQDIAQSFAEALHAVQQASPAVQPIDLEQEDEALLRLDKPAIEAYLKYGARAEFDRFFRMHIAPLSQAVLNSSMFKHYFFIDILLTTAHFVTALGGEIAELVPEIAELEAAVQQIQTAEQIYTQTQRILGEALNFRDQLAKSAALKLIAKAKTYIRQHYADPNLSLGTLAAHVNLSPSHFSAVFSREVGQTFKEYLTEVRIDSAKELLCTTSLKIFEIAYEVGYSDPHYFSAVFRKITGRSPTDFKKQIETS